MILEKFLEAKDPDYDQKLRLLGEKLSSPGYHTTLADGTWVHPTRESLEYAIALFREGSAVRVERAEGIVEQVLLLQDRNPVSPTYGIWSWFAEEPLSQMSPPDWNWADFQGLQLAEIVKEHGGKVGRLRERIHEALYHLAGSIYRRNVDASYTNISIMGAIVTSLVGEILGEERLAEYGSRRLQRCVDNLEHNGGFTEYNSPVYTTVVLRDCEKGLRLLSDASGRAKISILLDAAWQTIADHFHPATHQWAGPHSRSYSTFLSPAIASLLEARTGIAVPSHALEHSGHSSKIVLDDLPGPGCSAKVLERLRRLPRPAPFEIRRCFQRRESDARSTWGTTWFAEEACLGSVNADAHWDQSRPLLGYWIGGTGTTVALRLRVLRDGREFASAFVRNVQDGPRVLTAVGLLLNRGTFHPIWGAPKDNVHDAEDLRVRFELKGEDLDVEQLGERQFALRSGHWAARLSVGEAMFDGVAIPWRIERSENIISVDAICHHGPRRHIPFTEIGAVIVAAGVHLTDLREDNAPPDPVELQSAHTGGTRRAQFGELELTVPDHAQLVPYAD